MVAGSSKATTEVGGVAGSGTAATWVGGAACKELAELHAGLQPLLQGLAELAGSGAVSTMVGGAACTVAGSGTAATLGGVGGVGGAACRVAGSAKGWRSCMHGCRLWRSAT